MVCGPSWASSSLSRATTQPQTTRLIVLLQDHPQYASLFTKLLRDHRHHMHPTTSPRLPAHRLEETNTLHPQALHQAGRRHLSDLPWLRPIPKRNPHHISTYLPVHMPYLKLNTEIWGMSWDCTLETFSFYPLK